MRRALVLVALPLAAGLLAGPASAAGSAAWDDTRGEARPDVTRVTVSHDEAGLLRVKVAIPELRTLPRDVAVSVGFDLDADPATGSPEGAEALFRARDGTYGLDRWTGETWEEDVASRVIASYREAFELSLPLRELRGAERVALFVLVERADASDRAPDAGAYPYEVRVAPRAASLRARFSPTVPRAGRAFTARATRLRLSDGSAVAPRGVRCTAMLGRRALRGRGPGGCTWDVPRRKAAGRRLTVRLTVLYGGRRVPFAAWTFRVAR